MRFLMLILLSFSLYQSAHAADIEYNQRLFIIKDSSGNLITIFSPFQGNIYRGGREGCAMVHAGRYVRPQEVLMCVESSGQLNPLTTDVEGTIVESALDRPPALEKPKTANAQVCQSIKTVQGEAEICAEAPVHFFESTTLRSLTLNSLPFKADAFNAGIACLAFQKSGKFTVTNVSQAWKYASVSEEKKPAISGTRPQLRLKVESYSDESSLVDVFAELACE